MRLLREVIETEPYAPPDGWSVGHLANLGILLSCDEISFRFDDFNLNLLFDFVEDGEIGEIRDHDGRIIEVDPTGKSVVLHPVKDEEFPNGLILDKDTLKEMGIEEYEEEVDEPESEFDPLVDVDTIDYTISEGVKKAYRRVGKKIKRGFRVTSGFRKGRVVAKASSAFKPRAKAKTRMKLKIAARKKKIVRLLKGRITRRKPLFKRLKRMNKTT